jgi:hypothetical protein
VKARRWRPGAASAYSSASHRIASASSSYSLPTFENYTPHFPPTLTRLSKTYTHRTSYDLSSVYVHCSRPQWLPVPRRITNPSAMTTSTTPFTDTIRCLRYYNAQPLTTPTACCKTQNASRLQIYLRTDQTHPHHAASPNAAL